MSGSAARASSSLQSDIAKARGLEQKGRLEEAEDYLKPHLGGDSPAPEAAYRMGCLCLKRDDPADAVTWLRVALDNQYEDPRIHTNLGVALDLLGQREEAIRAFRRAIQVAPGEPAAHLNLGAVYGEMGRYPEAVRELTRCLELSRSFDATFNLALVRLRLCELGEAERLFEQAVGIDRRHALAQYYLGLCRFRRGLLDDAVRAFRATLQIDGELVSARYHLGRAYTRLGQFHAAVAELKKVARALPDDVQVHQHLGIAYDGLGMKSESLQCFRRARILDGS